MTDPLNIWSIKIEFPKDEDRIELFKKKWSEGRKKRKAGKDMLIADMLKNSPDTSYNKVVVKTNPNTGRWCRNWKPWGCGI